MVFYTLYPSLQFKHFGKRKKLQLSIFLCKSIFLKKISKYFPNISVTLHCSLSVWLKHTSYYEWHIWLLIVLCYIPLSRYIRTLATSCEELTHWKRLMLGGIGGRRKRGRRDEMAGWRHRLDGREFEWTLGVGDGQGGLACCDSWGRKESDTTGLNWTEYMYHYIFTHIYNFIYLYS